MNETEATQPIEPTQQSNVRDAKPAFWRRKPVWITAIVVGSLALGGAGAAFAIDEFDDDDRATAAAADAATTDDGATDRDVAGAEGRDARDADDIALTDTEYADASTAALAEAGGGTVTDVDRSDDPGVAFEVDVLLANGDELEIDLDADFAVVASVLDPRD
ncbi:MAG TPA: hypothetical protein VNJ54_01000 [Plantibacter sp.]|uniref:hypothetical protein n=1 Tax=unclassified Plantibacter TaxID=2624265 RepID=UPI002C2EFF7B|nr:hypothetical protein [Plantibacter sp.]